MLAVWWDQFTNFACWVWAGVPGSSEFWAAIMGALVGGGISYFGQWRVLRDARENRREDYLRTQKALANALLFKVMRIHGDFEGTRQYIEDSFADAAKSNSKGEPWQFVLPLMNFPDPVHLSAEEMGMVLGLQGIDVFNTIASLDIAHNSLIEATRVMSVERRVLVERLKADQFRGNVLSGELDQETLLALKPQMIGVDSLIEQIRVDATRGAAEASTALNSLHKLFQERLGLAYKIENIPPHPVAAMQTSTG
jgi:hypothetical protein